VQESGGVFAFGADHAQIGQGADTVEYEAHGGELSSSYINMKTIGL
jgi:hypothetical protein